MTSERPACLEKFARRSHLARHLVRRYDVLGHDLACSAVTHAANSCALKQNYPAKPVRIVEPFGVGGGPDLLARTLAPKLSKLWGQPVTVENRPGAGATAGPAQVAKAPADGYTLLMNTSAQAYSAALDRKSVV